MLLFHRLAIVVVVCANLAYSEKKIVTTIEVDPFLKRVGDDRYEGFIVDLMDAVARKAKFQYEFRLVADNAYGMLNETSGHWSGMMGEVMDRKADLAAAPLTVSARREQYVQFTPFMSVGISILMKKPSHVKPPLMAFLDPFSSGVWLSLLFAYIGISLVLYLIARLSPLEQPSEELAEAGPSAALMLRTRSFSGRVAGVVWWLMTLVVFAWYTANLTATLTVERSASPIYSADDLANQHLIKYGCLKKGATSQFFQNSTNPIYQRMWNAMTLDPSNMMDNHEQAIERVRSSNGKYAFLLESSVNDYVSTRPPCDLYKLGKNIDSKSYGIATPKGSNLKAAIDEAVKELRDSGELKKIENKWWVDKNECDNAPNPYEPKSEAMTMSHLAGAFYLFIVGILITAIILLVEILLQAKKDAKRQNSTFGEAIRNRAKCCRSV